LFRLDPEQAHDVTFRALDWLAETPALGSAPLRWISGPPIPDPIELMGLRFPNRVGLAAGLDKNARHLAALTQLGFGFLEVGTVTPRAQPGNPQPRMFRLPEARGIINRLGFNNDGLEAFVANVLAARSGDTLRGPLSNGGSCEDPSSHVLLGINIGKNASTPIEAAADDYALGLKAAYPLADYITVNISSPNTSQLRALQGGDELTALLVRLRAEREALEQTHGRKVPLLVKIAPDLEDSAIGTIAKVLPEHGIDGVIATNTTIAREAVKHREHGQELGGLSGAPVREASNRVIRQLRARLPAQMPIIGVGGILSGADAVEKIEAGASLVQLYTGLLYRGPALVSECAGSIRDRKSQAR
jgi:dihydroorotate dehydrogenase